MIFRQFMLDDLQSAAYLVGDADAGVAAVIDPHLNVEEYLDAARMYGVTIEHVLETHTHADRVSGHGLLAARGATIHIHRAAEAEYPHEPFDDGWTLRLGTVEIRAMHTPGHRPEHTAFVLTDLSRSPEPWAVLTGDSLFVSDIGRPDLAVEATEGARDLFHSLHQGLLQLPETTEVWPGHMGGSLCGGPGMDLKTSSTIGYELRHNPLLGEDDEDAFVREMTSDLPPQPANLHRIVELNRGPLREAAPEAAPRDLASFAEARDSGALVIDVRDSVDYDARHIPGSLSIPAGRGGYANRLAWLAHPGEPILLVGYGDRDAAAAARLSASVGIDSVEGYLAGGIDAWLSADGETATIARVPAAEFAERLEEDDRLQVLDVRELSEVRLGTTKGAVTVPYHQLRDGELGLDPAAPVAVICASGQRAGIAGSILEARGFGEVIHVTDGGVADVPTAQPAAS